MELSKLCLTPARFLLILCSTRDSNDCSVFGTSKSRKVVMMVKEMSWWIYRAMSEAINFEIMRVQVFLKSGSRHI